jgi:hypothetical protein
MSAKTTMVILAGLFACAGAVSAQADIEANRANGKFTCPGSAAKQDWMLIGTSSEPFYCKLSVNSSNKLKGSCFTSGEPDLTIKASGSLSVDSKCDVSGDITFDAGEDGSSKGDVTANMTKSQTTIIGIIVSPKGSTKGQFGTFTAIRMEQ